MFFTPAYLIFTPALFTFYSASPGSEKEVSFMEKQKIYDELCRVLTDYENDIVGAEDLYNMLVHIQNNWEAVITNPDENNLAGY